MTPEAAIKICLTKYAKFDSRAPRSEFWGWAAYVALIGALALWLNTWLGLFFFLAVLTPSAAVSARRLHDTNRTGWWTLLAMVPLGQPFLAALLVFEGTIGPNKFGPDPFGRNAETQQPPLPNQRKKATIMWQDRQ